MASARRASRVLFRDPDGSRIVHAVDQVRVHVLVVARGVVAHRVEDDRRMVLRPPARRSRHAAA